MTGEGKALTAEVSIRDDQNKTYFFEINSTSLLSFACKRVSEELGNDEGASDCAANADTLVSMPLSLDTIAEIVDWESLLAMYQVGSPPPVSSFATMAKKSTTEALSKNK